MSQTVRSVCHLCGSAMGRTLEEVSDHLAATHRIGQSCSEVLAMNLFTSSQAREEVWVILKDLELKRQNMERMRARMEEAEKHATMLMFLNDSTALQQEEVKQENYELRQLLTVVQRELKCYKLMFEKKSSNKEEVKEVSAPSHDQSLMLNDIIALKLELLKHKSDKAKLELERDSLQKRNDCLEEQLDKARKSSNKEIQLKDLREQKSNLENVLKSKEEDSKVYKQREEARRMEVLSLKEIIEDKDIIIKELTTSLDNKDEETKKSKYRSGKEMKKKFGRERKALEVKIVAKDEEIYEWKAKFYQAETSILDVNSRMKALYTDLYLLIFLFYLLLLTIAVAG